MSIKWKSVASDNAFGSTKPASSNAVVGPIRGIRPENGADSADETLELGPTIGADSPHAPLRRRCKHD
jgi:hypothetical protein